MTREGKLFVEVLFPEQFETIQLVFQVIFYILLAELLEVDKLERIKFCLLVSTLLVVPDEEVSRKGQLFLSVQLCS